MNWIRLLLSAGTAGIIAGGGVALAAEAFTARTWIMAAITCLIAASKDIQAQFGKAPNE